MRGIGWAETSADGALATFHGVSMISTIPIALLSDKVGSRRAVLMAATLMITIGVGLLSIVDGPLVWGAVIMAGMVRDGFMAIFMTMVMEIEGVGAAYAGTAVGMALLFARLGSLISPPLGNSLAGISPGSSFILWAGMAAVGFFGLYFAREGGVELAPDG